MNVFCRNCGKAILENADVCIHCGVATGRTNFGNQSSQNPPFKSSAVALVLTILWPGAGHLYLGQTAKGQPFVIANAVGFILAFFLFPISFLIWVITLIMTAPGLTAEVERINRENTPK